MFSFPDDFNLVHYQEKEKEKRRQEKEKRERLVAEVRSRIVERVKDAFDEGRAWIDLEFSSGVHESVCIDSELKGEEKLSLIVDMCKRFPNHINYTNGDPTDLNDVQKIIQTSTFRLWLKK
jgi:hypothetical protein